MNDVSPDMNNSGVLDEDQEKLNEEISYFEEIKGQLLGDNCYKGKFVVMRNHEIVDTGGDKFELARKVMKKYPGKVFLIRKVTENPPVVDLPSVEVE
nr:DUF5678 domain-containing protein [Candidatus Sigynarchaeota archaeon]